jgi:L-fuconolactonase
MPDESIQAALKAHPVADLAWLARRKEEIVEPALPIIDPHHHLWDHPGDRYLLDEALQDFTSGHNVVATVHLQCRSMYRASGPEEFKPVGETEFINGIAAQSASGLYGPTKVCAGIVGTVDLLLGNRVEPVLESHLAAGGDRFRGVRPTIVWHESKEVLPAGNVPNVLSRPEAMAAVKSISKFGLSLDLWAFFTQLDEVAQVCRDNPDLTVVVNHAGGPLGIGPYADRREDVFVEWRKNLEIVSRCENAVIKLGGLAMRYGGFAFNELPEPPSSDVLVENWKRYFDVCIELFGPQRCMFESNFPVDRGMCSYQVLWNAFKKMTKHFSETERRYLFSGTAARVYRLAD